MLAAQKRALEVDSDEPVEDHHVELDDVPVNLVGRGLTAIFSDSSIGNRGSARTRLRCARNSLPDGTPLPVEALL
jgi:hypothetical protein